MLKAENGVSNSNTNVYLINHIDICEPRELTVTVLQSNSDSGRPFIASAIHRVYVIGYANLSFPLKGKRGPASARAGIRLMVAQAQSP